MSPESRSIDVSSFSLLFCFTFLLLLLFVKPTTHQPTQTRGKKGSNKMAAELVKKHLDHRNVPTEDGIPLVSNAPGVGVSDRIAFAFDIDGVLMKGGKPVPEGIEALRYLNGQNPYGMRVYVYFIPPFL